MPEKSRSVAAAISVAIAAAAVRLLPLQWLHPLQWDEIEYFRATDWVARGLVPYRDFWEHHTPLQWFLFAPIAALTKSPGVDAIVAMRWAQVPLWIATFWLAMVWMRDAGVSRFARWSAIAFALCSSFLMIAAIEYRVDTLGCLLVMVGLVLVQRGRLFPAGVVWCLAGLANLRLGPVLAAAALLVLLRERLRALWLAAGVAAAGVAALAYFAATDSLTALRQFVWVDNYVAESFLKRSASDLLHRLVVPFGVRLNAPFDPAGVDAGGVAVLVLGLAGVVFALRRWRARDDLFFLALLQLASLLFIARMKFVYNYHFEIIVIVMLPLIALAVERLPRKVVLAMLAIALAISAFASVFRGKEIDRRYQDVLMREVDARTRPGDRVWDGVGWPLRREPAYRLWFLPDLARQLVTHGLAAPIDVTTFSPAAIVADHNALIWLQVQPDLQRFAVTHYLPVWRNLWLPGLSARLDERTRSATWIAPADGDYRVYASPRLASHPWFTRPLFVSSYFGADAKQLEVRLGAPANAGVAFGGVTANVLHLRKGERVEATWQNNGAVGVFLVRGNDALLFRQPPPGATLDGAAPRVTHLPRS